MSSSNSLRSKAAGMWFLILLMEAVFIVLLVPDTELNKTASIERMLICRTLGDETCSNIASKGDRWWNDLFVDSGVIDNSFRYFIPTESEKQRSKGLEKMGGDMFTFMDGRLRALWGMVYYAIQRLAVFVTWVPFIIPFILAAFWDGSVTRKIKLLNFQNTAAPIFGAAQHFLIFICYMPLIYMLAPMPITPLIAPLWATLMAFGIMKMVSNYQRL